MSPPYLAGPRDNSYGIHTAPLLEHNWTFLDDGHDITLWLSPCLRIQVGWLPEVHFEAPIRIAASTYPLAPPLWRISLDDSTPTEFLTAVTGCLAHTLAQTPGILFTPNPYRATTLPRPRGWRAASGPVVSSASSPDGLARYSSVRTPPAVPAAAAREQQAGWAFTAGPPERPAWTARFSTATPRILVEAFHRAFTNPAPLGRSQYELDPLLRPYLITSPLSPPTATADADRGRTPDVSASRACPSPSTPKPPWPPTYLNPCGPRP
ncbi:DUF317 domain-containing protein [Streptomyces sp. NPDC056244]|uniref:DUF317 domain-containing protein n=1 Tax=Streptomyces sp. NPDC056244 TaxID=3345762 RepID=UPI0035DA2DF6